MLTWWLHGNYGLLIHKIEILSHGVDLIVEFSWKSDDLVDEWLAPNCVPGKTNFLGAYFGIMPGEAVSLRAARDDQPNLEANYMPNRGVEGRAVCRLLDEGDARIIAFHETPELVFQLHKIAMITELIEKVIAPAAVFPSLYYAATRVAAAALTRVNAEDNRSDRSLALFKEGKVLRARSK